MAALALFLCAVLAELVSLSLSEITIGSTEVVRIRKPLSTYLAFADGIV